MTSPVLIIGGGIGGLTLALSLHQAGIACRVFEAAPEMKALGVGINLLPHGMREMTDLGLQEKLARVAVETQELRFYNRFGQFIFKEPRGRYAGYEWPQLSIHRAALHQVLLQEAQEKMGYDAVLLNMKFSSLEERPEGVTGVTAGVTAKFESGDAFSGSCVIGCDGIHSTMRKLLFPEEGPPAYQGINMWRGVTRMKPFLGGATMAVAGWLEVGKMVIYPISRELDGRGRQLINWVAELQSPRHVQPDWTLGGKTEHFYPVFKDWHFEWLDCAALIRDAEQVLEYPMLDRDPLPWWTRGRITLLGDAAHPMYPRGSNGAGQAILDARALTGCLVRNPDVKIALKEYEYARRKAMNDLVLMNRTNPPDAILREVWKRSGDKPFERIEDVISNAEMAAMSETYKKVAGFERVSLARRGSLV